MAGRQKTSRLRLTVSPYASKGEQITAVVEGLNVPETIVEVHAPDTVIIQGLHRENVGAGSFKRKLAWNVAHVQEDKTSTVEIRASAGSLLRIGLCRITN